MSQNLRCLILGLPDARVAEGLVTAEAVLSISLAEFASHLPLPATLEMVVAPLFCDEFDALEIIETLGAAGYRGVLRIAAPKLPNRQIVLRELRTHAVRQGISLDMVEGA